MADRAESESAERALLELALGYTARLSKPLKRKRTEFDPATGKKLREEEIVETVCEETHVPPNVTALRFWLVNRLPGRWRERPVEDDGEELAKVDRLLSGIGAPEASDSDER